MLANQSGSDGDGSWIWLLVWGALAIWLIASGLKARQEGVGAADDFNAWSSAANFNRSIATA